MSSYHRSFNGSLTSKMSQNQPRKKTRFLNGRKVTAEGRTLRFEAMAKSANSPKKSRFSSYPNRLIANAKKTKKSISSTNSISVEGQGHEFSTSVFSASAESDDFESPSIVMMSSDIALEESVDNSFNDLKQHNGSVVVVNMDCVGESLEDGVSFSMLDDYTIDIHASDMISEHVALGDCDLLAEPSASESNTSFAEHVIFESDTSSFGQESKRHAQVKPGVIAESIEDTVTQLYGEARNIFIEPECQMVIKVSIFHFQIQLSSHC